LAKTKTTNKAVEYTRSFARGSPERLPLVTKCAHLGILTQCLLATPEELKSLAFAYLAAKNQ